MPQSPQVLITGIGLVTGLGPDRESTWKNLLDGAGAVRRLRFPDAPPKEHLPQFLGAPVDFPLDDRGEIIDGEPNILLARQAAQEAVTDAGIAWDRVPTFRRGAVIGTSKGGMKSIEAAMRELFTKNPAGAPELWPMFWPNTPAAVVARDWGLQGAAICPVAACATGLMSLWRGAQLIQTGACDVVLAGSTDASLRPAVLGAFSRMGVLADDSEDPRTACRPFDRSRSGFVVGEGAAVMVLENARTAKARGAVPYAEWLAGGSVSDPSGIARLDPEAPGLSWLIGDLLKKARVGPHDIDYINMHGTGTRENDPAETRGVKTAFQGRVDHLSCSSLKGALGHALGAAGSVELASTLLAMRDNIVPATRNLKDPDPACDLNYTPIHPQPKIIRHALKLSLGFGGHQVAALLRNCR